MKTLLPQVYHREFLSALQLVITTNRQMAVLRVLQLIITNISEALILQAALIMAGIMAAMAITTMSYSLQAALTFWLSLWSMIKLPGSLHQEEYWIGPKDWYKHTVTAK